MVAGEGRVSHPSLASIEARVCGRYRLRSLDIRSARRSRDVVRPRQIAMYLSKHLTLCSLPQIGRFYGGRDHSTVIHAIRKINDLRLALPDLDADVRDLIRDLDPHLDAAEAGQADLFVGALA
jgi:chromosomal replication initiator protein